MKPDANEQQEKKRRQFLHTVCLPRSITEPGGTRRTQSSRRTASLIELELIERIDGKLKSSVLSPRGSSAVEKKRPRKNNAPFRGSKDLPKVFIRRDAIAPAVNFVEAIRSSKEQAEMEMAPQTLNEEESLNPSLKIPLIALNPLMQVEESPRRERGGIFIGVKAEDKD